MLTGRLDSLFLTTTHSVPTPGWFWEAWTSLTSQAVGLGPRYHGASQPYCPIMAVGRTGGWECPHVPTSLPSPRPQPGHLTLVRWRKVILHL